MWVYAMNIGKKAFKISVPNLIQINTTVKIINMSLILLGLDICIYIFGIFLTVYTIYNENGLKEDSKNFLFLLNVFPMIFKLIILCWIAYVSCKVTD